MELTTSWKEEGRLEGIQQGMQQGMQQGTRQGKLSLITRLLERRLGQLTPGAREQIQSLAADKLEHLGDALFDFTSTDDLIEWLRLN
jgi:flagellar biosynthesis/type III secretory pathway protein FliH